MMGLKSWAGIVCLQRWGLICGTWSDLWLSGIKSSVYMGFLASMLLG